MKMRHTKSKTREELLIELEQGKLAQKILKNSFVAYRRKLYNLVFKDRLENNQLLDIEKEAFISFWGLKEQEPQQVKEVAEKMKIHPVRVSQLNTRAMKRMFHEDKYAVPVIKKPATLKKVKGTRTLVNLKSGDILVTPRATLSKVLNANGKGESRMYGISYEAKDPGDDNLKRFAEFLTAFELNDRGYSILT